jgi:L-fucose mutarotase
MAGAALDAFHSPANPYPPPAAHGHPGEEGMLIGLDPLLSGEALGVLRDMGHGNSIAIVDSNFPAHFLGPPAIRMDADIVRAGRAILSVFPLDSFVEWPLMRMEVIGRPNEVVEAQAEFATMVDEISGEGWSIGSLERYAFYETARDCVAVFATLDRRPYANFILFKGVVGPEGGVVRQPARPKAGVTAARRAIVSSVRPTTKAGRR